MKKLITMLLFGIVLVQASCTSCKKEDDVYLYLTQEQKDFINTVHEGDTAIWKNSLGLKDTAVVNSFENKRFLFEDTEEDKQKVYGEWITYDYRIVGLNKFTSVYIPSITVETLRNSSNSLEETATYGGHPTMGVIGSRVIGGTIYQNVFWTTFRGGLDTVYWNSKGFLGAYRLGDRIEKIK